MTRPLESVDVAILAGGLGTRIRSVLGKTPKVLAPIAGRPFLAYLLDWLASCGARRFVLCLGYQAEQVHAHLKSHTRPGLTVVPVVEPEPLGTAGALRWARPKLTSDPVLVLNGDTFVDVDLGEFLHGWKRGSSELAMLCVELDWVDRFGRVELDPQGRVLGFAEKSPYPRQAGLINAGIYLFAQSMLDRLARMPGSSLEKDFFPALPAGTIQAKVVHSTFIDIGVPDGLAEAQRVVPAAAAMLRAHSA
jgi:mannose-1-phosphate guanylyltransferase